MLHQKSFNRGPHRGHRTLNGAPPTLWHARSIPGLVPGRRARLGAKRRWVKFTGTKGSRPDIPVGFFLPYSTNSSALVWLGKLDGRRSRSVRIPIKFEVLSAAVVPDGGTSVGAGCRRTRGAHNDMGSRVPASSASRILTPTLSSRIGPCVGLAALMVLLGNNGLESAVANGDTRTLSLHHIHTDEDITITYKRDGRYDEEALKRLDRFVRDWRKEEDIHMDPRLFDVIWEVSRQVGGDKTIHVVCGYRSPATNAMLRRRSNGVAQFSQHMLGKAMDFYIPGAPLEEVRNAGLRLQRGGVGYYPSSGSPFVHLDVGSVRYWPRMTHDQLARVFPN